MYDVLKKGLTFILTVIILFNMLATASGEMNKLVEVVIQEEQTIAE